MSDGASYLTTTQHDLLKDWGQSLLSMFDTMAYLVGSATERQDWRDVDVRIMLDSKAFDRLETSVNLRRLSLCLSLWGEKVTGLPIDCQVQNVLEANAEFGGRPRNALFTRGWEARND